jgi:hypothetical protein
MVAVKHDGMGVDKPAINYPITIRSIIVRIRIAIGIRIIRIWISRIGYRQTNSNRNPHARVGFRRGRKTKSARHGNDQEKLLPIHNFTSFIAC